MCHVNWDVGVPMTQYIYMLMLVDVQNSNRCKKVKKGAKNK